MYISLHIDTYTYICMQRYTHTHIHIFMFICMCTYIIYVHACMYIDIHKYIRAYASHMHVNKNAYAADSAE